MLNDDKTEFLLVGTRKQLTKVSIDGVRVGDYNISPSPSVRNLGTWFDPHLDMDVHITKTCSSAFYYLYNIRHIRKYLSRSSTETLIHAFITSRLDYCNGLLYGLPKYQLSKLLISVLPPFRYNLRRNDDYAALLTFPKIRNKKTLADRSFSCAAPRLWNLLPTTIKSTSSLDIFKIRLKTFLFNRAFN